MALRLPIDKLKEFLVDTGLVSLESFQLAQEDAQRTGQDLVDILISRGFISEDYVYQFYSDYFKTPFIKLRGRLIKNRFFHFYQKKLLVFGV